MSRTAFYMSAMVASRRNPLIREFYERLVAKDKSKKEVGFGWVHAQAALDPQRHDGDCNSWRSTYALTP